MQQFEYEAFISYSHRDSAWAAWVHKRLETYRPPKSLVGQQTPHGVVQKRLRRVFRDRDELASSSDLGGAIAEALRRSACLIVICSPRSAQSRYVNDEILAFKRLGREARIFCLIVGGDPNASDDPAISLRECFAPALRYKLAEDGSLSEERAEPIAADARDGKDGKHNALLKVIAGVLGVGLDTLKQRELHRRQRRLAIIATGATAGMVLTTGLAAVALVARANAERQRQRAEIEAETARQTTGFMVDLFRISDPGEARGNTVTAREMLDKGAARIQSELSDQAATQATLMDTVGTVYMNLGLYNQARPLLEGALAKRQALLDAAPATKLESLNHLGALLNLQAEYGSAERHYRGALAITKDRGDAMLGVTAESLAGLGIALHRQGQLKEAQQSLERALSIQRQLHGESHVDIAQTLSDLATVRDEQGELVAATALMEQALAMQRKLRGNEPHPATSEALNNLALLLHSAGNYDRAELLLLESLGMKRKLLGEKHPEIALALNNVAYLLHDGKKYMRAETMYKTALSMQRELVGNVHPDVAETLNNMAFLYYDRGAVADALSIERESLAIYSQLFPGDHPEVAKGLSTIGGWLTERREYKEAEVNLKRALEMRRRLLGDKHPQFAATLVLLAKLQLSSGRSTEALASAREARVVLAASLPPTHWRIADAESVEGAALSRLGRFAEAEKALLESYAVLSKDSGVLPIYKEQAQRHIEELYARSQRPEEALRFRATVVASGAQR